MIARPGRIARLLLAPVVGLALSCSQPPLTAAVAADAIPKAPALRLPDTVKPVRYRPTLTVVPTSDAFSGQLEIDVEARAPVPVLWLHARDLVVSRAEARQGQATVAARVLPPQGELLGLAFDPQLAAGAATIALDYTGVISSRDSAGVFRAEEGGAWYASTQFEPLDARRAYPCFDEPGFKVPWQLTLKVKTGDRAFSNSPVESETVGADGFTTVRFAPTPPMPSYLTAFAVGPWERLDAGAAGEKRTKVGVIVPRGMAAQATYAVKMTGPTLAELERYFGIPYPFDKLDVIAVPLQGGAMENTGLITFASTLLTVRPGAETPSWQRAQTSVMTHELSHMWFGDLVTMAWWDDLWLNEAFATWVTMRVIGDWQPTWGYDLERVRWRGEAMATDRLVSARKIRQPIESEDDVRNAFDGITYGKGAAVIHMFETWVGRDAFQKGVRRYLTEHAHGSATVTDFLGAVSAEAKRDVQPAFATFLDQGGVPLVTATVSCPADGKGRLELTQERYFPLGAEPSAAQQAQTWQIPLCARWHGGDACTVLQGKTGALDLPGCPQGLMLDAGANGYFHLAPPPFAPLTKGRDLSEPERLGALVNLRALARAGRLEYAKILEVAPALARDGRRQVVQAVIEAVGDLREMRLVGDAELPRYQAYIRDHFGARARMLGFAPKKGESADVTLLRPQVLDVVGVAGNDPAIIAEARKLATSWLADHGAVDATVAPTALRIAAQHGDAAFFDAVAAALGKEKDRGDRAILLRTLGSFGDPALTHRAFDLMLTGPVPLRESATILMTAPRTAASRPVTDAFIRGNFDALVSKLPEDWGAVLVFAAAALCDEGQLAAFESYYKGRIERLPGGPRDYALARESLRTCAAAQRAEAPSVASFFKGARASR